MPTDNDVIDPHLLEQLPTLPGTALEFLRICEDPTAGVRDVAEVAQSDPALLARIVQMANSPFYSPREPVTDVRRAAAILGLRSLKMIGVGFAILGDLWSSTDDSAPLAGIIGASTMAGSGARSFSARLGTGRDDEALTAGLLSFIGELALLRCYPDRFNDLWTELGHIPPLAAQRESMGVDGVTVGELLMERWNMPAGLRDGVISRKKKFDDRLRRSPSVYDASLGFGTAIAELLGGEENSLEQLRPAARKWGLADEDFMAYWSEFRVAVRRTNQQLGFDVGTEIDALIVGAREEYLASPVHSASQLDAARREIEELKAENERLEGLSLQDPLTGAPNRAAFANQLRANLASMTRNPGDLLVGVAMFDVDNFKQINDGHGHLVGDQVLKAISSAALGAARQNELFARLGGDEFAMVFRPKSIEELEVATERVRLAMVEAAASLDGVPLATVSAGAAVIERRDLDIDEAATLLTAAADDALYAAKRQGRNRIFVTSAMSTGLVSGSLGN